MLCSAPGGGSPAVRATEPTVFSAEPAPFGVEEVLQAFDEDGSPSVQAGGHPYTLATGLDFTSENETKGNCPSVRGSQGRYRISRRAWWATPRPHPSVRSMPCSRPALLTACPPASRIGTLVFEEGEQYFATQKEAPPAKQLRCTTWSRAGFPAEFGFTYLGKGVYMYASAVRIDGQLRLRVTVPGIPELGTMGVTLQFYNTGIWVSTLRKPPARQFPS